MSRYTRFRPAKWISFISKDRPLAQLRRFSSSSTASNEHDKLRSRLVRFNSRLPQFLQRFTIPLLNAPLTHISAFLILHELTAVVPLFGLAGLFHYTQWLPSSMTESKWVAEGVEKLGRYARRKGWLEKSSSSEDMASSETVKQMMNENPVSDDGREQHDRRMRLLIEFAVAYAITKALLPLRVMLSVSATPWFAATVLKRIGRFTSRSNKAREAVSSRSVKRTTTLKASPAAGTNAVGGGALPSSSTT